MNEHEAVEEIMFMNCNECKYYDEEPNCNECGVGIAIKFIKDHIGGENK